MRWKNGKTYQVVRAKYFEVLINDRRGGASAKDSGANPVVRVHVIKAVVVDIGCHGGS
jgi:hypothetical protein